ncbi:MAG: general secretion pathway protein GspK [Candidatus Omnitrophica bacterium]|nr:general secretion pathway protein GspK [Candidatus Omnitrophota bacterium]
MKRARGSILVVVVWAIALLGMLAGSLGSQGVGALQLSMRMQRELRGSYVALAAVERAVSALEQDPTPGWDGLADTWASGNEEFINQPVGEGWFSIEYPNPAVANGRILGLIDEERFLNLNTAPVDVLQRLFRMTGRLRDDDARAVAEAIEDWRDADQDAQPHGAEGFYYLGLPDAYECKNGPFENAEELRLIRGVTPEAFGRTSPYVTVYGSGKVNLNTAPAEVLAALGLSPVGVAGLQYYRDGDDGIPGNSDDRAIDSIGSVATLLGANLTNEDLGVLRRLDQQHLLTVKSEEFRAEITAGQPDSSHTVHVRCVLSRTGDVRAWEEW